MARTASLVLVAVLITGVVAVAVLLLRGPLPATAPMPVEVAGETATEQALREEIARLQARLALYEQAARRPPETAEPSRETQAPAAAAPAGAAQPEAPDAGASAAAAWLRQSQPDRFGGVTAAEARYLRELELRGHDLTDADLRHLAALGSLRRLSLRSQPITDAGLAELAALEQLGSLDLRGTPVTGSAFPHLPAGLIALDLTDSQVRPEQLGHLARLQRLHTLDLNRLKLGDADVEAIGRCSSLRHLELDGTAITDQGVRRLLELNPDLERLEVRSTAVSKGLIAELRQRYPRLVIVHDSPLAWR